MRAFILAAIVIFFCVVFAHSQTSTPPSASELSEIAARGQAIAEHDAAAWHAGDAFMAAKPDLNGVEKYLARKTEKGWVVVWGRFDETRSKFLVLYQALQGATPESFTVEKVSPPLEDTGFYLRAAKAKELAIQSFQETKPNRPFNATVLPSASGRWYVYFIPAQTTTEILPYGGDIRYTVSEDGTTVLETRQMHKIVLEERLNSPQFGFHTHVMSDSPEDSDIFYAIARRAKLGEWLATRKYSYELTPQNSIKYLGRTETIIGILEDKQCGTLQSDLDLCEPSREPMRQGVIAMTRRLISGSFPSQPFDAFPTFKGATCRNGSVFLEFDIAFYNFGQSPIVLHKDIGTKWAQARFGGTVADVMSGKYEKLGMFSTRESDITNPESFFVLKPGEKVSINRYFPVVQVDLRQKPVVQLLLYTWPVTKEDEAQKYKDLWAKTGVLYTEPITTGAMPLQIDQKLLRECGTR